MKYFRKIEKFSPSQKPYFFNIAEYMQRGIMWEVEAIWFSRKNKRNAVSLGMFSLSPESAIQYSTMTEMLEHADTRYGGNAQYRWDGEVFWGSPTAPLVNPVDLAPVQLQLDTILNTPWQQLTTVLPGTWIGPYYSVDITKV